MVHDSEKLLDHLRIAYVDSLDFVAFEVERRNEAKLLPQRVGFKVFFYAQMSQLFKGCVDQVVYGSRSF